MELGDKVDQQAVALARRDERVDRLANARLEAAGDGSGQQLKPAAEPLQPGGLGGRKVERIRDRLAHAITRGVERIRHAGVQIQGLEHLVGQSIGDDLLDSVALHGRRDRRHELVGIEQRFVRPVADHARRNRDSGQDCQDPGADGLRSRSSRCGGRPLPEVAGAGVVAAGASEAGGGARALAAAASASRARRLRWKARARLSAAASRGGFRRGPAAPRRVARFGVSGAGSWSAPG